ncbi:VanZ family protein [Kineococcus sp. R86509]|uniref:VanZ family protein n=1 Tax=Kineococcus sp. R86509 TaxID=3093851 RepID=UPI0036D377CC
MVDLRSPSTRRLAVVAFAVYVLVLAGVAFLPLPGPPAPGTQGEVAVNLSLSRPDLLGGWEAQRNVLMTVPFGVLLPLVVRWRYELMVLACVGVTLIIETGQLLGSLAAGWAWRAFDVNDLLNNTVGGLLGLALTGAALLLTRRPHQPRRRLPLHRLVAGTLAAGLVGWAAISTLTTPPYAPPVDACEQPPAGATTELPGGVSAYAAADGSLCITGAALGSTSVAPDTEPGLVAAVEEEGGGGVEVGVAPPGAAQAPDGRGNPVRTYAVEGADLRVWTASLPGGD